MSAATCMVPQQAHLLSCSHKSHPRPQTFSQCVSVSCFMYHCVLDIHSVLFRQCPEKADKDIYKEISAIIRQITSTITFLPLIEDACAPSAASWSFCSCRHMLYVSRPYLQIWVHHANKSFGQHSGQARVRFLFVASRSFCVHLLAICSSVASASHAIAHAPGLPHVTRAIVPESLEHAGTFDLLLYTDKDVIVPDTWEDRDEPPIHNASEIVLRKFSTKIHDVSASVLYKNTDSEDEANSDGNPMDYGAMVDGNDDSHAGVSDAVTV